jgi:hypothetical protein
MSPGPPLYLACAPTGRRGGRRRRRVGGRSRRGEGDQPRSLQRHLAGVRNGHDVVH